MLLGSGEIVCTLTDPYLCAIVYVYRFEFKLIWPTRYQSCVHWFILLWQLGSSYSYFFLSLDSFSILIKLIIGMHKFT